MANIHVKLVKLRSSSFIQRTQISFFFVHFLLISKFLYDKSMSKRCVVFGCSNTADHKSGISIHLSPMNKTVLDAWKRFVRLHRVNFNPNGRFGVCSNHFQENQFSRYVHVEGQRRVLIPRAIPTIWVRELSEEKANSTSDRSRRQVSEKYTKTLPCSKQKIYYISYVRTY